MRVLFVRHAESTNNVLQHSLVARMRRAEITEAEAMKVWRAQRSKDAPLTEKGLRQAAAFGKAYETAFEDGECVLVTSGMERAIQTGKALRESIVRLGGKCDAYIRSDTHEVGGLYLTDAKDQNYAVEGKTAAQLRDEHGFNTERYLPNHGSWYTHPTGKKESSQEANARARHVAKWLYSADAAALAGARTLVFVAHDQFLSLLLSALLDRKHPVEAKARQSIFKHHNTGTTLVDIDQKKRVVQMLWMNRHVHLGVPTPKL